jgi:hypothetical protein
MTVIPGLLTFLQTTPTAPVNSDLKPSDWIMIAAIIIGPILAVVTQLVSQKLRQKRDQKLWVFNNLMIHRHVPLNFDFVKAANFIDVAFYGNKKVRERWGNVLTHLCSDAYKPENFTPAAYQKFRDLLSELLTEMAKDVGYSFDFTHIKENAWHPSLHGQEFEENIKLRRALLGLVEGKSSLNVVVAPHPQMFQPAAAVPAQPAAAAQIGSSPQPPPGPPAQP